MEEKEKKEEKEELIREPPYAGSVPEWSNRPIPKNKNGQQQQQEQFLQSDMSQPDLSAMWECPLTRWDYEK